MEELKKEEIYYPKFKPKIDKVSLFGIIGIIILIILVAIAVKKKDVEPVSPKEEFIQNVIDSAAKDNVDLQAKQTTLDSIAHSIDDKLNILDGKLNKVKNKETIIREYYHDRISKPGTYTPQQVDSFFKDRYNY